MNGTQSAGQAAPARACRLRSYVAGPACTPALVRAWRMREVQRLHTRTIRDTNDARDAIAEIVGADLTSREHAIALGLDRRNQIVAVSDARSEHTALCAVRPQELLGMLFREADPAKISAVILGHNHPSGYVEPSPHDIASTAQIVCDFGGYHILDHVVIAYNPYSSPLGMGVGPRGRLASYSIHEHHPALFPESKCRRTG